MLDQEPAYKRTPTNHAMPSAQVSPTMFRFLCALLSATVALQDSDQHALTLHVQNADPAVAKGDEVKLLLLKRRLAAEEVGRCRMEGCVRRAGQNAAVCDTVTHGYIRCA